MIGKEGNARDGVQRERKGERGRGGGAAEDVRPDT